MLYLNGFELGPVLIGTQFISKFKCRIISDAHIVCTPEQNIR